jgi:hypothetical protein
MAIELIEGGLEVQLKIPAISLLEHTFIVLRKSSDFEFHEN